MAGQDNIRGLGLDQSLNATGWAIGSPCEPVSSHGVFRLKPWGDEEGARLHSFATWLHGLIVREQISHVFYEAPVEYAKANKDFSVTSKQGMQIGIINLIAYTSGCAVYEIDVNQMRSRFIGTSKAPPNYPGGLSREWLKNASIKACAMRGLDISDDNEAEACGHLDFGLSIVNQRHCGKSDVLFRRLDHQHGVKVFRGEA